MAHVEMLKHSPYNTVEHDILCYLAGLPYYLNNKLRRFLYDWWSAFFYFTSAINTTSL